MASTYPKQIWVDEAVQYPDRYTEKALTGGMVNLIPAPGIVDTVGTPQSAVNFNRLENGVLDAHIATSMLANRVQLDELEVNDLEDETIPELGTAMLTNTKKFPFNYSVMTIPLKKTRKTLNYSIEVLSAVSGDGNPVGEITFTNKQLNGFAMSFTGSAQTATVAYKIIGGFKA
jgi:hypothetical protein